MVYSVYMTLKLTYDSGNIYNGASLLIADTVGESGNIRAAVFYFHLNRKSVIVMF